MAADPQAGDTVVAPGAVPITAIWVRRAKEGDPRAWAELYTRTYRDVFRRARYLTGDPDIAEDVTQEVFAYALRQLHTYEGRAPFVRWLQAIAMNLARKHWRRRQSTQTAYERYTVMSELQSPPVRQDLEMSADRRRQAAALYEILAELPEQLREAFILSDLEKVPGRDAADILGITPQNLWVRASRARAKIRDELAARGLIPSMESTG